MKQRRAIISPMSTRRSMRIGLRFSRFYESVAYVAILIGVGVLPSAPAQATTIVGPYSSQLFGDATLQISPAVLLQASAVGGAGWNGSLVTIWYNWTIDGPVSGEHVPVRVDWNAFVAAFAGDDHSDARALATIDVRTPLDEQTIYTNCAVPGGGDCANRNGGTISTMGAVGYVHNLSLDLNVSAMQSAFASGWIDPHIYVDPNFLNADQYSIVVSPGVSNAPAAVPEPATFWLFGSACGVAWLARKRKRLF
jgi:hypothetical protein